MNLGNTFGKPRKEKEPPVPVGCFNPFAKACWITGVANPEKDTRPSTRRYIKKEKRIY